MDSGSESEVATLLDPKDELSPPLSPSASVVWSPATPAAFASPVPGSAPSSPVFSPVALAPPVPASFLAVAASAASAGFSPPPPGYAGVSSPPAPTHAGFFGIVELLPKPADYLPDTQD